MPKPTYADIAREASVGTATVERVLNGRGGVREDTAQRVVLAARRLDWPGRFPERHQGIVRIEVIMAGPETSFFHRLASSFRRIARTLDPTVQLHLTFLDADDPATVARRITNPSNRRSGLVLYAPGREEIKSALATAHERGESIVQVVTRSAQDIEFVGIDNYAAGRMAGMMMARLNPLPGRVVALCHSQAFEVHRDRIAGFSDYLSSNGRPDITFAGVLFGQDDHNESEKRIAEAMAEWPDLSGVYNAGGANLGAFRVLRAGGSKVFFVGHELNPNTRAALEDGTADVIFDQLPEAQARRSIDILLGKLGLVSEIPENAPIRFTTITAENL